MPRKVYYDRHKERLLVESRQWRLDNHDKFSSYLKKWRLSNPEYFKEYQKSYREKDGVKQKIKARSVVNSHLRNGRIVREICSFTECEEIGHAHHDNYSRPLDIVWVCRKHHENLHHNNYK